MSRFVIEPQLVAEQPEPPRTELAVSELAAAPVAAELLRLQLLPGGASAEL